MKVVEHTYPIFVLCVIYLIYVCRDTRKTNDLQDAAQEEFNKSLSFLMESINNLNSKIEESEITKKNHIDEKKDDDQHKVSREDVINNDEMKEKKSNPMNSGSIDHDVSFIPTYQYRKSFDAANRKKNKKDTMKEIWSKQQISLASRKAILKSQDRDLKEMKDLQKNERQFHGNVYSRKLRDKTPPKTTTSCVLSRVIFPDFVYDSNFAQILQQSEENNLSPSFDLTVNVTTDDYAYEVGIGWTLYQKDGYDMIIDSDGWTLYQKESYDMIIDSYDNYFTSQIFGNTAQTFDYYCVVSHGEIDQTNDYLAPTCFEFELHNYMIDGVLTDFGSTSNVTMSINNNEVILAYPNKNRNSANTSFCIGFGDKNYIVDDDDYTKYPSVFPSSVPSKSPSSYPTVFISYQPSTAPSETPTLVPSIFPSISPSVAISSFPSLYPTQPFDDDYYLHVTAEITVDNIEEMEAYPFETSCTLVKTEISICEDDPTFTCSVYASQGWCIDNDYKEMMTERCQKSCNRCPPPIISDFPQEPNSEEYITNFNLDLTINTDANSFETSWVFLSDNNKDIILDSNEMDTASELLPNTLHKLNYSCALSYIEEKEMDPDTIEPFCYNLEVHDSFGDGLCCDNGPGYFSMSIDNTKNETLEISNPFYEGNKIEMSFCINNQGNIGSDTENMDLNSNQPTYYPMKELQCKNKYTCVCDSKPNIFTDVEKSDPMYDIKSQTLFGISRLSQSDKVQDVESPQYKAACWVLFDDPYRYVTAAPKDGLQTDSVTNIYVEVGAQKRMMQRYALAVLYFSTAPKKWGKQYRFLSKLSECRWNKELNEDGGFSLQGSVCDNNGNIISVYLKNNNLDGTIIEELNELKMLEVLDLSNNNIQGSIPSVLGQLSQLRSLYLSQNQLGGSIHPLIFDARNLEIIELNENKIRETIPDTIVNLRQLISLNLNENEISGSIPDAMYSLRNLQSLNLGSNKFSSSISPEIGNLNKLKTLHLRGNILSGQIPPTVGELTLLEKLNLGSNTLSGSIPSTVGKLSLLSELALDENQLTGEIPESLFNLSSLRNLKLQYNAVSGTIPDQLCEIDGLDFQADCKNDLFKPLVSCSCCVCIDRTPIWDSNDKCADATMKIVIDRSPFDYKRYSYTSDGLEWSITNDATQKKIPLTPLSSQDGDMGGTACVAYSDCISIDMISPPIVNTFYNVYWNDAKVVDDTHVFPGSLEQQGSTLEYNNEPFQFYEENQRFISCYNIKYTCDDKEKPITLEPNTIKRVIYNKATKISGREKIHDTSSPQSKALCSLLRNETHTTTMDQIYTDVVQRYVLLILHFTYGLFGDDEYPLITHECDWNGITCRQNNGTRIVTGISLSSEYKHIINGTLTDELARLKYLKVLELNQTQLYGTIPRSYSNLWSLTKINLSGNNLSGTIPKTFFHQKKNLEHIDLSDNSLSGSINDDIGSLSHIRSLSLGKNEFTGSLPLDRFKYTDLEHLNVGGNNLAELDFSLILGHKKLKTLDLSPNFFRGSIPDHTFTSLQELQYFNISQNDFSGTLPSIYTELSNITHFDAHANRLQGTIPRSISVLSNIQHINLQGNKLTGRLPSELNQLKNLNTLVLSHNELKGFIPFDPTTLQNIDRLHLQSNKLSGEAPIFSNMTSYITDCGFPSDSLDPVSCTSCNMCCNSDGACQSKSSKKLSQVHSSLIFMFTIIVVIIICYALKDHITSNRHLEPFFSNTVYYWNALMLISDKSVYHFLLIDNKIGWCVAFFCGIFQSLTLFLFVHSADIANKTSDREYTMTCPANSLDCEDSNSVSSYGIFIFGMILTIWLLRDIVGSVKLMLVSFQKRDVDFFFTSGFVFSVTMLSLWTSISYIQAIAVKNTDMIKDAVVLLFVVEIDERLLKLIESLNPDWVLKIDRNMRESLVYEGKDLVISSWMNKYSASFFRSMRLGMRGRNESTSVKQKHDMDEEAEGIVEMEEKDQIEAVDKSNP